LGTISLVVFVLRLRGQIGMEAATVVLISTVFAISPHIFPWYTTALLPWIAMLIGPLWVGKSMSGKGLAIAMVWYFTFTVLVGYFISDSRDWRIYYALVYDVVLLGLAVAVVAEVRAVRLAPLKRGAKARL
jgi:hypothetical protein